MSLNFENRPTYQELREELISQISETSNGENKLAFTIYLSRKYSHKAIRQVLRYLGYTTLTKSPKKELEIKKILKKKKIQ